MATSQIKLFNESNGSSCLVDAGDGGGASRMKSWLEEVSRWLREAVEPSALKGIGLGRVANFPAFLNGEQISGFDGVNVSRVVPQTAVLAVGDGSVTAFGNEALTQPDRSHADYFNTTTDPDDPVAPRGASASAFLQTIVDGGGDFALTATSGILTIEVNGERFTYTGLIDETSAELIVRLSSFGFPVDLAEEGSDTVRIFAPGKGITSNIKVVSVAGDAGAVLFTGAGQSSQPNVLYTGTNGPLGVMDNLETVGGAKPQRKILPLSVSISATVGASVVTLTDDGAGALSDVGGTHTGTINYTTGVISLTFATAPDSSTNVVASWKALKPLVLTDPARIAPRAGLELAVSLK